jgi:molecular chaperone DnaK
MEPTNCVGAEKPVAIGIDLGVFETTVATPHPGGAYIVKNTEGNLSTPSVVMFDDEGRAISGREASQLIGVVESGVHAGFIRELGQATTPTVTDGRANPTNLTAILLKDIASGVIRDLGPIGRVTIAISAGAPDAFRGALLEATKKAGLRQISLIDQPTAAAIYLSTRGNLRGKYLFVHLNKAGFDASVIEAAGDTLQVTSSAGVQGLNSDDFRGKLLQLIADKFREITGSSKGADQICLECCITNFDILRLCELLGKKPAARCRAFSQEHGRIAIELTQAEFLSALTPLLEQLRFAAEEAILRAQLDWSGLAGIFLVCEEADRPFVEKFFAGFTSHCLSTAPVTVFAQGAAIHAGRIQAPRAREKWRGLDDRPLRTVDLAPCFFGLIETDWLTGELRNRIIIPKGEPLPVVRVFRLKADASGQIPELLFSQSAEAEPIAEFGHVIGTINHTRCRPFASLTLTMGCDTDGAGYLELQNDDDGTTQAIRLAKSAKPNPDLHDDDL